MRTGVTVILPHDGDVGASPVYAGCHRLNGNGELTGLEWVRESGLLTTPIAITNTHSVGVVRDALVEASVRRGATADDAVEPAGRRRDLGRHAQRHQRLPRAGPSTCRRRWPRRAGGPVAEGNVGGGTGMICHEFKGGIGTASRVVADGAGGYMVGVLVQANYGGGERLSIDGVPVGRELGHDRRARAARRRRLEAGAGSIIGIVATDAPLLPLASASAWPSGPALGMARRGGAGEHSSGDIFLAFATGNRGLGGDGRPAPTFARSRTTA